MDWQPIETAPKDQEILLASRRGRFDPRGWEIRIGQWLINRFPFVGSGQPTHWAPLPFPPKE